MKKPMIGVIPLYDEKKESYWMLPGYMKGIEAAGGIPVMLPLTTDGDIIHSIANTFDGFLFTGGQDVSPTLYGENPLAACGEPCDKRDIMEGLLFTTVLRLNKPSLGICRGLQLFNVLLGGTLYQDIPSQMRSEGKLAHKQSPPYNKPSHLVHINKASPLYSLLNVDSLLVNSYHHQGIKDLSEKLVCAATAPDGLIEAVYMPEKRFVLAVQWHPEFSFNEDEYSLKLFTAFVKACEAKSLVS